MSLPSLHEDAARCWGTMKVVAEGCTGGGKEEEEEEEEEVEVVVEGSTVAARPWRQKVTRCPSLL